MARSTRLVILINNIYILYGVGSSSCDTHSDESNTPFNSTTNGYKNQYIAEIAQAKLSKYA